jgi:hypothetical protein
VIQLTGVISIIIIGSSSSSLGIGIVLFGFIIIIIIIIVIVVVGLILNWFLLGFNNSLFAFAGGFLCFRRLY